MPSQSEIEELANQISLETDDVPIDSKGHCVEAAFYRQKIVNQELMSMEELFKKENPYVHCFASSKGHLICDGNYYKEMK